MPADPNKVRDLFLHAVGRVPPEQWESYVAEACGGDAELGKHLGDLLRAHRGAGSFLDRPAGDLGLTGTAPQGETPPPPDAAGTVIGPYKLLQQIGEGGMGTVFMAEQTEPVRRKVALKVIKPGMDSKQVVARFEAERQALAIMDHPNIARVFDGGATAAGRPFFVMELVHGVPITKFCDDHQLPPRARLELIVPVCHAIQHAHQKGIIHRDIKPSNVMVTLADGRPVPKVIDFGVAKATEQQLTERTLFTQYGTLVGTLEYMSPEQAETSALGVDTRSDVYSLGVMLYELLTGTTPLSRERLRGAAFGEILRLIREDEPPRPSTRLSDSGDALASISARRQMEPAKLTRLVRGELDWIVMKCLEKDRSRRYESANALAADIQCYLADEPVRACPPSARYRFGKFVRRNKPALAVVAAIALVVLVAAGSVGWTLNERSERRRQNAAEIVRAVAEGRERQARRRWPEALALARHAKDVLDHTGGQDALRPSVEELLNELEMIQKLEEIALRKADVSNSVGLGFTDPGAEYRPVFRDFGIDVLALEVDAAADVIRRSQISNYLVEALDDWTRAEQDRPTRARISAVARAADPDGVLARWRAALDRRDHSALQKIIAGLEVPSVPPATLAFLGRSAFQNGLRKESLELLLAAYARHPDDFWINHDLAYTHTLTRPPRWDEALRHYTAALALRPRSHMLYLNIGVVLNSQGRPAAALAAWRNAVEIRPDFAPAHNNIGVVLKQDGKYDQAEAAFRLAIDFQPDWADPHNNLARLYTETNRTKEAFASFDRALALNPKLPQAYSGRGVLRAREKGYDKAVADFHLALKYDPTFAEACHGLGSVCEQRKQFADAVKWYETALRHDSKSAVTQYRLGVVYSEWGRHEATNGARQRATEMFDKAIAHMNEAIRLDGNSGEAWYSLGNASRNRGQIRAAITAFEKAIAIFEGLPAKKGLLADARFNLGNIHLRLGDYAKAIDAYRAAIVANPDYARAYANLGNALIDQGHFAEAQKMYADALARDNKSLENITNPAVALDRQGRYADALAFLRGSLEKLEGGEKQKAQITEMIGLYERFVRVQKQLPTILAGEQAPAGADLLQLGEVCIATKDYAAAARFYHEAFAKLPGVAASLQDGYRFDAARAAACAGVGLDKGASPTPAEQTRWRKQSLDWLRADLSLWAQTVEKGGPMPATAALQALQRWRHHAHLAGVRGTAIDKVEPDERDDWRKFWADVDTLVKRIPIP